MHAKLLRVLAVGSLATAGATVAKAESYKGEIYPLSKVKRGQKGYGVTTLQGTTPERFEFEVIGVNHNFLPKMDIILVKSDDPKVQVSGFWQGMSGSPLFIEGKLACAFSYGFRFNKLAIGGCTPVGYMKTEGFQERRGAHNVVSRKLAKAEGASKQINARSPGKHRGAAPASASSLAEWLKLAPKGDVSNTLNRSNTREPWLLSKSLAKRSTPTDSERGMVPSAVPLALSGFSAPAFEDAKRIMSGFPVEPMQAGGTGSADEGPTEFQMGGAIAVQLVRGDMSAAATGTVSLIDGDGVLAFGHPMFHAGEIYAPVAAAEIHTVIPSAQNAFIVSSPLRELGSLTQDRQSTIAADTSLKVDMIPMRIRIKSETGKSVGDFQVQIVDSRFFTATFASIAASNAASLYLPDREHVTVKMRSKVELDGYPPLEFVDFLHSGQGASDLVGSARGLRVISPLMNNPFGNVGIKSIDLEVEVAYDTNTVEITGIAVPSQELVPGKKNTLDLTLEPFQGKPFTKRISFDVPKSLAGAIVNLEVTAGDAASLYIAPPKTTDDLVAAFRTLLPGTTFAVTVYSAEEAAAIDGRLIEDMPASAINKLRSSARTPSVTTRRAQSRTVHPAKQVVEGTATMLVKVAPLK